MSLYGLALKQGGTATVHRPSGFTVSADGAHRTPTGYTVVASDLPLFFEGLSIEKREKVFASAQVSTVTARDPQRIGIQIGDRLVVTGSAHAGTWRVEDRHPHQYGGSNDHDELALVSTDETVA